MAQDWGYSVVPVRRRALFTCLRTCFYFTVATSNRGHGRLNPPRTWPGCLLDTQARDQVQPNTGDRMKKPVWDKARPKSLGESKPLSPKKKAAAKAQAKRSGKPYPSLVANMRAAKKK